MQVIKGNEIVRAELLALERDGRLTPADVVEAARDPDSPLHEYFEWDDREAAERFRIVQARILIRVVKIVVSERAVMSHIPLYVHSPGATAGYVRALAVRSDIDRSRDVLIDELKRVIGALNRAEAYARLFDLDDEVIEVRQRVAAIANRGTTIEPVITPQ